MAEHDRDTKPNSPTPDAIDPAAVDVTQEVGSEGGGEGDVELAVDRAAGTGSEAGELWRPAGEDAEPVDEIVRDETGIGRRSP